MVVFISGWRSRFRSPKVGMRSRDNRSMKALIIVLLIYHMKTRRVAKSSECLRRDARSRDLGFRYRQYSVRRCDGPYETASEVLCHA